MTIHLRPELEALIQQDVERGAYQSADEFVAQAVQMLHEHEQWLAEIAPILPLGLSTALARRNKVKWWRGRKHFANCASGMTSTARNADGLLPAHPGRH